MHKDRALCIHLTCTSCLIKVPPLNIPPHLPLEHLNSLSRCTATKTRTDGHKSPLQVIMHLLIRLEWFEDFFYGRMITFLLASLVITFLGVLLTCCSLLAGTQLYYSMNFEQNLTKLILMVKAKIVMHCFNYFPHPVSCLTVQSLNVKFTVMLSVLRKNYKT